MPPPTEGGAGASEHSPDTQAPLLRPLLPYDDPWTQLRTRDANLDAFVKPDGESLTLAGVRDIAQQRRVACVRAGTAAVPPPTGEAAAWLRRYLASLDLLVERGGGVLRSADDEGEPADGDGGGGRQPFETEWTSPLSGRAARFIALRGAAKEQAMALFLYGALLRQLGHQDLDDLMQGGAGGGHGEQQTTAAAAAKAKTSEGGGGAGGADDARPASAAPAGPLADAAYNLRRAAGVFRRLADRTLPAIFLALGTRDRPLEITPPCAEALCSVCLAEAQQLAAFRAEGRGSPPGLRASLHLGASDLYSRASKALREGQANAAATTGRGGGGGGSGGGGGPDHARPGDRLARFLALSRALASARALRAAAADYASKFEAGCAERCCDEAARELAGAKGAAEADPSWRALVGEEQRALEREAAPIRKDRLFVTVQPVPRDLPALPEAKVIVAELPFNEPFLAGGVVDAH